MSNNKISKAERKAAGMMCLSLFSICNSIHHGLLRVTETHPPSGGGTGAGLTDKEKEFVRKLATDFHKNGEILRKLGWRFLK